MSKISKMHYFSNKFSKIAKRWGLSVELFESSIWVSWSCVIWPNCGFSNWYDEIELLKISNDVIVITSPKNDTN